MHKAVALAALAATATFSTAAWACRCAPLTPAAAYRMADAVLLVEVAASNDVERYRRVYTVDVQRAWKRGLGASRTIATRRMTCMLDLAPGGTYLVYVTRPRGGMAESTSCSGSLPLAQAGPAIAWLDRNGKVAR